MTAHRSARFPHPCPLPEGEGDGVSLRDVRFNEGESK